MMASLLPFHEEGQSYEEMLPTLDIVCYLSFQDFNSFTSSHECGVFFGRLAEAQLRRLLLLFFLVQWCLQIFSDSQLTHRKMAGPFGLVALDCKAMFLETDKKNTLKQCYK
ncbi:hypothetical protein L1987_49242 [Smallanthus sonchifolius]|uniref:Uncharacterized protein n=1 Tax=Smallanthus sonchifolius TaxID=185202 RepID=A0ACB9FU71_9ASTR|nr:hypothetical protein L1987_49242 [Smallanthus sonchifolius]